MSPRRRLTNDVLAVTTLGAVVVALVPLVSIIYYVIERGVSVLSPSFLTQLTAPPGENGGIGNAIQGSLIIVGLGCGIGLPVGILSGIYVTEYGSNRLGPIIRFLGDVLAGIPSIVTGVFIYALIVVPLHHFSALAGGVAVGTMMIPIVSNTTAEALKLVPNSLREAALALGIRKWRSSLLVMSIAKTGVTTGALLSVSRITGETAPLLLTALSSTLWFSGLGQPAATMTVTIYEYAISPFRDWQAQAWGASLVLMLIVLGVNLIVRIITGGTRHAQ
jgi:phosphate transport system permease protein